MNATWSPSDIDWSVTEKVSKPIIGGALRPYGRISRFRGTSSHAQQDQASLSADHPAITNARTIFPKSVVRADVSPRVLISGMNSAKIGKVILKGPWRGLPVYTMALEERATCPSSCALWSSCYGNAMPFARRHSPGPELIAVLGAELHAKARKHPGGFAVRVHVLGDFYNLDYLKAWLGWMDDLPGLRVWGYTAHHMHSVIGRGIDAGNDIWPDRWAFRFSVTAGEHDRGYTATTIWRKPEDAVVPEGQVCPMQMGKTQACATCGLCWSKSAADKRIVFVGHGMRRGKPSA